VKNVENTDYCQKNPDNQATKKENAVKNNKVYIIFIDSKHNFDLLINLNLIIYK